MCAKLARETSTCHLRKFSANTCFKDMLKFTLHLSGMFEALRRLMRMNSSMQNNCYYTGLQTMKLVPLRENLRSSQVCKTSSKNAWYILISIASRTGETSETSHPRSTPCERNIVKIIDQERREHQQIKIVWEHLLRVLGKTSTLYTRISNL